jgi:hypothetical protein
MTLDQLLLSHADTGRHATNAADALRHADAAALLEWCIELPNVVPGPHARAFAFERLLDAANEMLRLAYADHLADDEPDDPTHATERQFWRQLSVNIAAQMGDLENGPPLQVKGP